MKAFLLAAGNGTRLRPLTDTKPKCLLSVKGQPLLAIWLELCRRSGITDILLNVHAHAQLVREFVSQVQTGPRITVFEEPDLLGSGGTIAANRRWVSSEAYFWVLYADVLTNGAFMPMLQFHQVHKPAATMGVYRVPDPKRCGIVTMNHERQITEFIEKPVNPSSNLAFSGVLIGTQAMLDAIPDSSPADLGRDVLPRLTGQMYAYEIPDFLMDIGTMENYKQAQATWPGLS
jgi:mannose-1-phosphate guanylyltransferase